MSTTTIQLYRDQTGADSARIDAGESLDISDSVETANGRVYRRLVYLRVPRDGIANGIVLTAPEFTGEFSTKQLNVGQASSLLQESWQHRENKVIVHLQRPWHVKSVWTTPYAEISFFRMDGDAIADEAAATATRGQTISPEFVSQHFAMEVQHLAAREQFLIGAENAKGTGDPLGPGNSSFMITSTGTGGKTTHKSTGAGVLQAQYISFHGVHTLTLNSYPTTPRVSVPTDLLTPPGQLTTDHADTALDLLWQQAGEARDTAVADLSAAIESQLLPKIADAFEQDASGGGELWVPLVLDSDTPCVWTLTAIDLPYYFLVDRFEDRSDKVTLEFSDRHGTPQPLPLPLPAGDIARLSLRIDIGNKDNLKPFTDTAAVTGQKGLLLNGESWYAARIVPPQAGFYGAVSVLISALGKHLNLEASLIEGSLSPTGKPLASANVTDAWRNRQQWLTLQFDSLRLDATDYWLTLKAREGQCIWLCHDGGATAVQKGSQQAPAEPLQSIAQLEPVSRLLMQDTTPQANTPLFTLLADDAPVPLSSAQNHCYEVQTPAALNDTAVLMVQQVATGTLIFSQPEIEYSPLV